MLSDLHWMLCGAVQTTNAIFGGQLLAAMLCIFVHIIITPYFFFLDILYPSSTGFLNVSYLAVQSLWIVTHIMELVLLVLPCAATTHQANKTSTIICKLLNKEMSSETRKQVAGAVTTYLVILIQFQNSDTTTLLGNT
ncbi:gustatory receptor for sugar taste 43a-like isoform X2 [Lycorma delicatula]|uniref:gustatory receptor for sugar taste 43a-like isoform X2 n=1 Tax=Lycorma delicatula TaxID=130591 RepID=UPI003F516850